MNKAALKGGGRRQENRKLSECTLNTGGIILFKNTFQTTDIARTDASVRAFTAKKRLDTVASAVNTLKGLLNRRFSHIILFGQGRYEILPFKERKLSQSESQGK